MAEVQLTDENFDQEVLKADKPVLVDFWAEWCVPCKMLGPILEEVAAEYKGRVVVGKANTDECPQSAAKYNIQSIPSLLLFNKGEVVKQNLGVIPKDAVVAMFEDLLDS